MSDDRESNGLEGRIRELEATVETLTSELLDATERIRELEAALDAQSKGDSDEAGVTDDWIPATEEVGTDDSGEASAETGEEDSRRESDDIIVA